jgi:hypothetical protein
MDHHAGIYGEIEVIKGPFITAISSGSLLQTGFKIFIVFITLCCYGPKIMELGHRNI